MYEGPPVADEDVLSVYVVLNGTLGMGPGKSASQAFHCGYRVGLEYAVEAVDDALIQRYRGWRSQGRRVVVRVAETEHVFHRVATECAGQYQHDEGLTQVERGSFTAFVTVPYRRDEVPQILRHKRVQLYG